MVTIRGWKIKETEKAVLFVPESGMVPVWLPKSRVSITENEWDDVAEIPYWLAQNNGIPVLPPAPRGNFR